MCLFHLLFLSTPGTELYSGGALSIDGVILHLISYRHEVLAIAARTCLYLSVCSCVYLSVHVFLFFPLLAISKPICHIQLHLAESLRFEDITFLEGFWRRNITLTILKRQEDTEVRLTQPTYKWWKNDIEEGNAGPWCAGEFRECKCLVLLLRKLFVLWGTWMIPYESLLVKRFKKKKKEGMQPPHFWPTQCRSRKWCRTNAFALILSSKEQRLEVVNDFTLWWCPAWVWWRGQSPGSAVLIKEGRGLVHSQFPWCRVRCLQGASV